ncbi:MAG: flavodoxin domain-containing protein [Candidatus Pacearchaeota archaeon]
MVKSLVVYFTRTGTTKKVAEEIARQLSSDIEEIIDKVNRKGVMGFIKSIFDAIRKKFTEIDNIKKLPIDYDLIIVGSPVWAGTLSPAIRTYLMQQKQILFEKKVVFFCTMGGNNSKKIFIQMEKLIGKKPIHTIAIRSKEVKDNSYIDKIKKFTEEIKNIKF